MTSKENVTLYKCDFCKKTLQVRSAMERHEKGCGRNPANFSGCYVGCKHLKIIKEYCSDPTSERDVIKVPYCEKLKQKMYSCGAERRGLLTKYPEDFIDSVRMPAECEHFEFI